MVDRIAEWPSSAAAYERATRSLSGGVSTALRASARPHPIYFSGGSGAILTDIDGHDYHDYVLGWGPNILGHGNPALVEAVQDQIRRGATYGSGHHLEYLVAERLLERFPGMERVLWSNTGTEADLVALRLARAATGRRIFVKFAGHYHGWSDPMLIGYRPGPRGMGTVESRGQQPEVEDDVRVLPWGDVEALETALAGEQIAAVFLEPVLSNSGVIAPPEGYLAAVRAACDRTGTVLVFDEVITGLRIARGGGVERYGVTPDMVILAKAIAGGLTMSAILGRASLLDLTQQGVTHAGTYNGNPLVLAAAAATLDELDRPGTYDALESRGGLLAEGFRAALGDAGVRGAVNQVGPVVQVALGLERVSSFEDYQAADHAAYSELLLELLRRRVFAVAGGRWYLSTAHDETMIEDTIARFGEALQAVGAT